MDKSNLVIYVETILCRIVLETQQWLEDIPNKVIKHVLLQAGAHLGLLQCNNLVMVMCSREHILVKHLSITCLSLLMVAILPNQHLVDILAIGTRHQRSKLAREVVMITTVNNHPLSNHKPLVVQQHQQIVLVTVTVSHQLLAIISRAKVMLKIAMVDTMHLSQAMGRQRHMISNKAIILQLVMVM